MNTLIKYKGPLLSTHDLKSTIRLNWRLSAADLATNRQAIEREAMELVQKSKTAARLSEDLDVASGSAGLWDWQSNGIGDSNASEGIDAGYDWEKLHVGRSESVAEGVVRAVGSDFIR
jgi:hypothetical protein